MTDRVALGLILLVFVITIYSLLDYNYIQEADAQDSIPRDLEMISLAKSDGEAIKIYHYCKFENTSTISCLLFDNSVSQWFRENNRGSENPFPTLIGNEYLVLRPPASERFSFEPIWNPLRPFNRIVPYISSDAFEYVIPFWYSNERFRPGFGVERGLGNPEIVQSVVNYLEHFYSKMSARNLPFQNENVTLIFPSNASIWSNYTGRSFASDSGQNYIHYRNLNPAVSFQYPPDWGDERFTDGIWLVSPSAESPLDARRRSPPDPLEARNNGITFTFNDLSNSEFSNLTVSELGAKFTEGLEAPQWGPGSEQIYKYNFTIANTTFGGLPAIRIDEIQDKITNPVFSTEMYAKKDNILYSFTYRAPMDDYYHYSPIVKKIMNSFEIG